MSFNSTLVRLKHWIQLVGGNQVVVFQFHIGSIKTASKVSPTGEEDVVSIPHWFD